jgi:hypothetical protein
MIVTWCSYDERLVATNNSGALATMFGVPEFLTQTLFITGLIYKAALKGVVKWENIILVKMARSLKDITYFLLLYQ